MKEFPQAAIDRAKDGALEWLQEHGEGHPRSIATEDRHTSRRGYEMYDDFEAPPILGYEALERDGLVVCEGLVMKGREERVCFRLLTKAD
jgi:hypothetical protein